MEITLQQKGVLKIKPTFAEFLKKAREGKGYTVNQLALYAGVSAAQISRIENNLRGVPKPKTIKKLSKALDIPFQEMMKAAGYIDEEGLEENERPIELTEFLKKANIMFHGMPMSEDDKKRIEDVLTGLFYDALERRKKEKGGK